jgi:hypothetical protein
MDRGTQLADTITEYIVAELDLPHDANNGYLRAECESIEIVGTIDAVVKWLREHPVTEGEDE